jgi:hypothetical protein
MKKLLIITIILIGIGGGLVYADSIGLIDVFSSSNTNSARNFAKVVAFPESIGTYVRTEYFVRVEDECSDLADSGDAASKGLSGTVCTRIATAMYRDDATQKSVFVDLAKVTSGKESYVSYMKAFSRPDSIDEYEVIRMEDHILGWFPGDVFDVLITQEGQFTLDSEGNMTMSYGKATGQNVVSQYFLTKYPPVKENDPTIGQSVYILRPLESQLRIEDSERGQIKSITLIPESGPTTHFKVDFSVCKVGRESVYFGLGHTVFNFSGISNRNCNFEFGSEIEDPRWNGAMTNRCSIPASFGERKYEAMDFVGNAEELQEYCITL